MITVIAGIFSWRDGLDIGCKDQKAFISEIVWRVLVSIFLVIPLLAIGPIANAGLQSFIKNFLGLILIAIICWTAGLRYSKMQYGRKKILVVHLPFILPLGCALFYVFTAHEFSQVEWLVALNITHFSLALLYFSQHHDPRPRPEYPLIYSQRNWPDEFQQVLVVEVPKIQGRMPLWEHKDRLRNRYRKLAEISIAEGHRIEDWVADQLEVVPPSDDPQEIADSILNSEAFHHVLMSHDEPRDTSIVDQKTLRRIYDGTSLGQVVRLLREIYLNSLEEIGEMSMTIEPYQTPMAETHLNWMIEAMPNETERLYRDNKLKDHLKRVVLRAEEVMDRLTAQGLRHDEALELVTSTILASEIPYEEDEDGNPKEREEMQDGLRDEITASIFHS